MRDLALAEVFRSQGIECTFICKNYSGNLGRLITDHGYRLKRLNPKLSVQEDAKRSLRLIQRTQRPLVVVDNYDLDRRWEEVFSGRYHVLTIDDLASRQHSCHMYLNNNYLTHRDFRMEFDIQNEVIQLLGPKYVLLRKEFRKSTRETRRSGVAVFFGNYDSSGETLKVLHAIERTKSKLVYKLIVSKANRYLKEIKANRLSNVKLFIQPRRIDKIFRSSEIFLGSGGTITAERIICGLPGVVVTVADNQVPTARNLGRDGLQSYLGSSQKVPMVKAIHEVEKLVRNRRSLLKMRRLGQREIRALEWRDIEPIQNVIWVKKATMKESRFLFDLRKDPAVAQASIQQKKFSYASHQRWLIRTLDRKEVSLFVVYYKGEPCGQVRIDEDLTVSISLSSRVRGLGLSKRALNLCLSVDAKTRRRAFNKRYTALIRPENAASRKLFRSVGFAYCDRLEIEGQSFMRFQKRME